MVSFWIGDWVKHKTKSICGKYEGSEGDRAKLKFRDTYLWVEEEDLVLMNEEEIIVFEKTNISIKKGKKPIAVKPFDDTLDLHVEKLAPHLAGRKVEMILLHQISKSRAFIKEAIKRKQYKVHIIHGKGTGALKMEIEHLLMEFDEVYFTKTINNGGAMEIMFQY